MIYLALRTDSPQAELYLYDGETQIASELWQADRRLALELLGHLETFLSSVDKTFTDVTGLLVYRGPGSFTGLRIGITVMNTIAYANNIQLVGADGEAWLEDGVRRLVEGDTDKVVMPLYGADPRITKPTK